MAIAAREGILESFVIEGGVPLRGTVKPAGNKNAALPILAACLLTADPVTLDNVPRIRDVEAMIELLCDIGAEVEWLGPNRLRVWAAEITKTALDAELCTRIRASILFAGPLLARCGTRRHPASRRRRHRPAPRRYPPDGVRRPGGRRPREPQLPPAGAVRAARGRPVPRRGVRDRHRERGHGGGAGAGARRRSPTPPASRMCRTSAGS